MCAFVVAARSSTKDRSHATSVAAAYEDDERENDIGRACGGYGCAAREGARSSCQARMDRNRDGTNETVDTRTVWTTLRPPSFER